MEQEKTEKKRNIVKKKDLILILVILVIAAAAAGWYRYAHRTPAHRAEVRVGGQVQAVLDLSKDQEVTVQAKNGGHNILKVENGAVWCAEATCPDKVCVYQGKQSLDSSLIVCLPNEMIVTVIAEDGK